MIAKHDRSPVRTPANIEQKYKLGQDLEQVLQIAENAHKAATNAQSVANSAASTAADAKATASKAAGEIASLSEAMKTKMDASVYDPTGKAQDIFTYVDTAISTAITGAIEGSY